jgi:hypothetical protein
MKFMQATIKQVKEFAETQAKTLKAVKECTLGYGLLPITDPNIMSQHWNPRPVDVKYVGALLRTIWPQPNNRDPVNYITVVVSEEELNTDCLVAQDSNQLKLLEWSPALSRYILEIMNGQHRWQAALTLLEPHKKQRSGTQAALEAEKAKAEPDSAIVLALEKKLLEIDEFKAGLDWGCTVISQGMVETHSEWYNEQLDSHTYFRETQRTP